MSDDDGNSAFGAATMGSVGGVVSAGLGGREARRGRRWAQRMDATKYQRAVKDLAAAGLNPILAVKGGLSGAGPSAPPIPNQDVHSAYNQGQLVKEQVKLLAAQVDKTKKETEFVGNKTDMTALIAQAGKMFGDMFKNSAKDVPTNPINRIQKAIELSNEAEKISKKPGIELTDHSKKRLRETKYQKNYKNRRKNRGQRR